MSWGFGRADGCGTNLNSGKGSGSAAGCDNQEHYVTYADGEGLRNCCSDLAYLINTTADGNGAGTASDNIIGRNPTGNIT